MSEQEIIQNLLFNLKHMKSFFATFSQEASADVLNTADMAYDEVSRVQRACFDLMVDEGWLKVQYQKSDAIKKEYKKYENKEC